MHESDWRLLCGRRFVDLSIWRNGDFDVCFEELLFGYIPHAILALMSAYYIGRYERGHTGGRVICCHVLLARLVLVVMLIIVPLVLLLILFLHEHSSLGLIGLVTGIVKAASWLIHSGFVWRWHRWRHMSLRGSIWILFSILLVFLTSLIQLRTAIIYRLYGSELFTTSEEISTYIVITLHLCYLLTYIPSKCQMLETGLLNVQESFSSDSRLFIADSSCEMSEHDSFTPSGEDVAGLLSQLFFVWLQPLLSKGAKGLLRSVNDIPQLPERLKTEKIDLQFRQILYDGCSADISEHEASDVTDDQETNSSFPCNRNRDQNCSESSEVPERNCTALHARKSPLLLSALNKAFGREYYLLGLLKFISDALSFVGPVLLNFLVTFMENSSEPVWHGYAYAGLLLISTFISSLSSTHFNYRVLVVGLKIRSALITTVYHKTLTVSSTVLSTFSSGEVANFMSVDTDRIVDFCPSFHQMWSLPFQVAVALYLLYQQVGVAFLAGLGFTLLLIPINRWLAIKIGKLSTQMMHQKDSRVKVINEVLYGIRVVKFCALEPYFMTKIGTLRKAELDSLKGRKYLDAMCVYFWATTPVIISIITFTTFVLLGNTLTAAKVFTSIALFGILITPLNAFPWVINGMMEGWVSLKRLQQFMDLPDSSWKDYYTLDKTGLGSKTTAVCLRNCYFSWKKDPRIRDNFHKSEGLSSIEQTVDSQVSACNDTVGDLMSVTEENVVSSDDPEHVLQPSEPGIMLHSSDMENLLPAELTTTEIPVQGVESTADTSEMIKKCASCGWFRLRNINLTIRKGSLVGVIGVVGSGKSSLLSAITAEMHKDSGDVFVNYLSSGFGLVLQEPWIQQMTVQQNILFGSKYERQKYKQVIEACALAQDLKTLPAGDQTEIGESGITLSGGQRARIALARSAYQEKPLYILDDPLSAVDAHVAQHLFEQCIMGILKDSTRILATHHTRFLRHADLILVMDGGHIIRYGDPAFLLSELDTDINLNLANCSSVKIKDDNSASNLPTLKFEEDTLIQEEEKDTGTVKLHVYKAYWKAVGHHLALLVLVSLFLMQASRNIADWWLSYWVSHTHSIEQNYTGDRFNLLLASLVDFEYRTSVLLTKPWTNTTDASDNLTFYLTVYGLLAGANSIFTLARAFLFAYSGIAAAKTIHQKLLGKVIKASVNFFDVTPIGRIINRFSSDIYSVDDSLPFVLNIFLAQTFGVLGTIIICCYGIPFVSILIFILIIIYYIVQKYYRTTSRELKRISSITLSPIYAHFSETVAGLTTIRAFRQTHRFCEENRRRLDSNQRTLFASKAISQWLNIWLQMIGVVLVTGVAVVAVLERGLKTISPGVVGLAVSYVLSVTNLLSGLVTFFTETEKLMVSIERTSQYINDIKEEQDTIMQHVPSALPLEGAISFYNVCLRYRHGHPNALDGVSFDLRPKEKIGIVGRTGSGKSSLFLALFRLVEIQSGQILIDGIDIQFLSLNKLRSYLAIIPQDPFLFSGSIRENLDPRNSFSDDHLLHMLERCHLLEAVSLLGGLDAQVAERGRCFSVGQRQLMCLARALLTNAQVLCIDEATANIDLKTDNLIQQTIREEFSDRTVMMIAHRIKTVMHCDRVLVLSDGKVTEFDEPAHLLNQTDSVFYSFVNTNAY